MTKLIFRLAKKITINTGTVIVATPSDHGYVAEIIDLKLLLIENGKISQNVIKGKLVFYVAGRSTLPPSNPDKDGEVIINMYDSRREDLSEFLKTTENVNITFDTETKEVDFTNKN
jgi:hypothetical protein